MGRAAAQHARLKLPTAPLAARISGMQQAAAAVWQRGAEAPLGTLYLPMPRSRRTILAETRKFYEGKKVLLLHLRAKGTGRKVPARRVGAVTLTLRGTPDCTCTCEALCTLHAVHATHCPCTAWSDKANYIITAFLLLACLRRLACLCLHSISLITTASYGRRC